MADSQGFSNSAGPFGMTGDQQTNQGAANPVNWTGHQPTFYGNRMHMDMQGPPGFGGYGGGKGDGYGGGKGDGGGKGGGYGGERAITWNSKVFDTKIAEQKDRQFNGDHAKGDSWYRATREYLCGCCPDSDAMLQWAERFTMHESVITDQDVEQCNVGMCIWPTVFSGHLWNWLNLNVNGSAKTLFK